MARQLCVRTVAKSCILKTPNQLFHLISHTNTHWMDFQYQTLNTCGIFHTSETSVQAMKTRVNKFTAAYCQSSPQSELESPVSRTHWPQQRWGAGWSSWPCHEGCRGRNCSCDLHLHPRWGSSAARCAWHWLCATAHHWLGVLRGPAAVHHHQGHTAPGYALQKSVMKQHQSPMKSGIPKSLWLTRWQNQMLQTGKSLSGCYVMVWVLCDGLGVVWWTWCCVVVWVLCDRLGVVWSGCCVDWVLCGVGVVWWTGWCVVWMLCRLGVVLTGVVWWTGWCVVWASCGLGVVCDGLGVVSYLQSDWVLCDRLGVVCFGCCVAWVLCRLGVVRDGPSLTSRVMVWVLWHTGCWMD